jgi:predicted nuclease of predicted toxin-antitoxin system
VKFLIDAQLPARLARILIEAGHDAVHTRQLTKGNRTPDADISDRVNLEERVLITKDDDFVDTHLLAARPRRLLLVTTGNITNVDLEALVRANLATIEEAFETSDFVELSRTAVIVR